jgi:methanogen homoaconitase large subunit
MPGKTMAQKILDTHALEEHPTVGSHVTVEPDWMLAHDLSLYPSIGRMEELGFDSVERPEDVLVIFDHYVPSDDEAVSTHMNEIETWIDEQEIEHFYPSGAGICHNVMTEEGYTTPGSLIVGADSHTTTHGAFGAFGTGIGHTDLGYTLGSGDIWMKVPESRKVVVEETLPETSSAKDLALSIMDEVTAKGAIYQSLEFHGAGIEALSMAERATLSNLGVELGAMAALVPPDETTRDYLNGRTRESFREVHSDNNAEYHSETRIDATDVEPLLAKPSSVDNIGTVANSSGTAVDQVFVGTCNNSRYEDIERFAELIAGETIALGIDLIVVPGSRTTLTEMNSTGISNDILDAGGMIGTPGCGPCFGAHGGILGEGDTCLGTMNRNFPGRMGPGEIYLGSPHTAAAAAIYGEITDPREVI